MPHKPLKPLTYVCSPIADVEVYYDVVRPAVFLHLRDPAADSSPEPPASKVRAHTMVCPRLRVRRCCCLPAKRICFQSCIDGRYMGDHVEQTCRQQWMLTYTGKTQRDVWAKYRCCHAGVAAERLV